MPTKREPPVMGHLGYHIVVLDRGFVYVGDATITDDDRFVVIRDAMNIRVWGTTKGLGELAQCGPTKDTILDHVGTVKAPMRALISLIETKLIRWAVK